MQRLQRTMLGQFLRHQHLPALGNLAKLPLPFINRMLKELNDFRAQFSPHGVRRPLRRHQPPQLAISAIMLEHKPSLVCWVPCLCTHKHDLLYCKFTGIITYWKFGPPLSKPGRFAAESSREISSLSTTFSASTRKAGLNPISRSAPSYLHGNVTVASPVPGD